MRICQHVKHVQYCFNLLNPTIVFKCICVMLDYSDCKKGLNFIPHLLGAVHDLQEALLGILEPLIQNGHHLPHHLHYHVVVE